MRQSYHTANALLLFLLLSMGTCLIPTAPIIASPNTESSPSNFIFSFSLTNPMLTSSYLMIVFPIFPSTITPFTCTLLNNVITSSACLNLNTASATTPNPLTINTTAVNSLNPNIQSTLTVVTSFSGTLLAGTSYSLQIILSNNLPSIGALSESFQMYVISGSGVMQEQNWNMGQLFFELRNNNLMNVVSINAQNGNTPGLTLSNLLLSFNINVPVPTPLSTFLFTISADFTFTVSSLVTSIAVTGSPPQILSMTVMSPNIIQVIFNEQFVAGRQFSLQISNIYNPLEISSGAVSIYSLPYNSITPLEVSELSVPYQTVSYTPTVTILTAEGMSPSAPMEYYLQTVQYITVTILLPRNFDPSFVLQLSSDAALIQQGTVFAKTSTINSNTLQYKLVDNYKVQISGFSTIPSGSLITVTMSVWINTNPIFNVYVMIDTLAHINAGAPIIYGTSSATVSATPESFIAGFNGGETNKLVAMQSATSSISFTVTPLFQTLSGSFLQLYTSKNMVADATFNGATSCLINSVAQQCTIVTNSQSTVITIASSSSFNLYPQSVTTNVQINQVKFNYVSSQSFYLYHFYFQLTVSLATQATVKKFLVSQMVVPQRNQLTNFQMYVSNNIYNTGSNFLNVVRLVSASTADWQNIIQSSQRRIISIFAYQGWTNLFTTLTSYSSYPCTSNIAATFTYIQGSSNLNLTTDYPLNWDRINIQLPGTETSTKFSIVIPTQFLTTSAILFEIMVGFIDITNGAITYLQAGPAPTSGNPTYLSPQNILVYSKPKQSAMQLNIAGLAGSYMSNISFTVAPSASFNGNGYSTALIVMSSWQFFDSNTVLSSISLASANPTFANVEQTPLCLKISGSSYLTYIPFKTTAVYASNFNIYFNNIKLPYNLDLPYYSVSLIDNSGSMDGYDEFINQNQNIFYTGVLKNLSLTCNDNSLGVTNTYCTIVFTPFQDLEVSSVLILNLYGMYVATSLCKMTYSNSGVAIPITSCSPNTNLNVLTIQISNSARLSGLTSYTVVINGITIDASQISNYIQLQVMDPSGSYAIEQKSVILIPSVTQNFPIYITQVNFAINNPVVTSSLFLNFTLPRPLNSDESFALIMSKDFTNLNNIPCKMRIRLMQADGITEIPTQWILKYINSQIIFEGLQNVLAAASYSLEMYGIITPSTITQSMVGIIYLRIYDNTYSKSNTAASTAIFPSLVSKINSLITLQTYFNTEGLEQELLFTIINQYVQVNLNTVWIVNFPRYYSPTIWNEDFLIYCMINTTPLPCGRSQYTPYQLKLYSSPLIVSVGSTYTITVYGIPCPRAAYLNGNSLFITENIFLAMSTSATATAYSDYSQLFVSSAIINPMIVAGYGSVVLNSVTSSNNQVYQTTFFTITLTCSVLIPTNSWIFVTFPKEFNNFNNIPVVVQTQYGTNVEVSSSSTVINTRIGFQLTVLSIPASTTFQIIVTSLMTPQATATLNMNSMKVLVSTSDRSTTIAASIQSKNQLSSLTFVPNALHLSVNNYLPIQITAGTYSAPILINPSDGSSFLTNMMITFSSTELTFNPNPTYMYLGNSAASFKIGVSQNLIPTTYTFNLIKKETSISAYYSTLSEYAVVVSSVPISITFPSTFTVPIGGCSIPVAVSIANPPYSNININFQFDTSLYTPQKFWLNQEISYEQMTFTLNNTARWISFCSNYTQPAASFPITMQLGGDNAASYQLTSSTITINIVSSPALNATPTQSLAVANAQKSYANFQVTTNVPGHFFYEINLSPLTTPYSLADIEAKVKASSTVLQSSNDYISTQIYNTDRDHRVGFSPILNAGSNYFNIESLLPQRAYTLCGYFKNQFGLATNYQCVNFTTQTWGSIQKTYVSFSTPILANQLNNLLCFFVKAASSEIGQIVDLEGSSCSLNTSPQNYYYHYTGNTTTNQYSSTIIYHIASQNLTSDASISAFNSLFSSNTLTAVSKSLAQTYFSINFIGTSTLLTQFDPMTAIQLSASTEQPQFSFTVQSYSSGSYQVKISSIQSTLPSTLYFILVSFKNITKNQISSKTNITIKPRITPTNSQIASCLDGEGNPALQCFRVVMQAGTTYTTTITNLVESSVYTLYYVVANEYPLRPVFYGSVQSQFIFTTVWESSLQFLAAALLLSLLLII